MLQVREAQYVSSSPAMLSINLISFSLTPWSTSGYSQLTKYIPTCTMLQSMRSIHASYSKIKNKIVLVQNKPLTSPLRKGTTIVPRLDPHLWKHSIRGQSNSSNYYLATFKNCPNFLPWDINLLLTYLQLITEKLRSMLFSACSLLFSLFCFNPKLAVALFTI